MIHTLKAHFPQCFDKNGDLMPHKLQEAILDLAQENQANLAQESTTQQNTPKQKDIAQDSQEKDAILSLSKETYTLNWLGKSYAKLLRHLPTNTLIAQDLAHNAKAEHKNSKNVLIKGDNLEVLKHLKNAYYNKIKMIYIDPPYNTGKDGFIYNDERNFTPQSLAQMANIELDEANKILNYTLKHSSTHSAWLSFMYPRLYIARQLLRDDGVIFISIDDNEQANLKILCDEIFGEENFVADLIWRKIEENTSSGGTMKITKTFRKDHEYIICYAKSSSNVLTNKYLELPNFENEYKNLDNDPRGEFKAGSISMKGNKNSVKYYEVETPSGKKYSRVWRITKDEFDKLDKDNRIYYGKNGDAVPQIKIFINEERLVTPTTIFENLGSAFEASECLKCLFSVSDSIFSNPKPINLIKRILEITASKNSNDIILDFFAGSGTTAHAVMELNAQDNGNRQFILVQLDEKIDSAKSKVAYDFCKNELGSENPTIFDITKERIKRAGAKIAQSQNTHANLDLGFKVYEIRHNDLQSNNDSLFDSINLSDDDKNALLESFKLQDSLPLSVQNYKVDLGGYEGILAGEKLYLLNPHFETKHLQNLIKKIDTQKDFVIKEISYLNNVFDSARIREIEEGITSYPNKKGLKILVRARFI